MPPVSVIISARDARTSSARPSTRAATIYRMLCATLPLVVYRRAAGPISLSFSRWAHQFVDNAAAWVIRTGPARWRNSSRTLATR